GADETGRFRSKNENLRFGELFFLARDFRENRFALDREGNENRLAIVARDTFPAKSDVLDFELDRAHVMTIAQRFNAGSIDQKKEQVPVRDERKFFRAWRHS